MKNKGTVERIIVEEVIKSITCDFCGFTGEGRGFESIEWIKLLPINHKDYRYSERREGIKYAFDMCYKCLAKMKDGKIGTNYGKSYINKGY